MAQIIETDHRPVAVETRPTTASAGLRIFQIVSAIAGAVLFGFGLAAVFDVDFGAGFLDSTGVVAGYAFSPAGAIAAILLGGAILISTLADQDRGSAAFIGLLTVVAGIAALIAEGQTSDFQVDDKTAAMFIVAGAVVFLCSLVPWWGRRRVERVVR
jgi:hypothetical protein